MRHHRADVVERAVAVLDTWGLADLTMRRLGAELGVQPSAIYHHFANKQALLAAVADELLARGARAREGLGSARGAEGSVSVWDRRVTEVCDQLRDAMLAYRDGAELVATVHAFGLGAGAPYDELVAALASGGCDPALARAAARTLLHFVFGHTSDEQTHLQAGSAGALPDGPGSPGGLDGGADFALGLGLILDGVRARVGAPSGYSAT